MAKRPLIKKGVPRKTVQKPSVVNVPAKRRKGNTRLPKNSTMIQINRIIPNLDSMAPEILLMIIESLYKIDSNSILNLLRVNHRFRALAMQYAYRAVELTPEIAKAGGGTQFAVAFAAMSKYTKHILAPCHLGKDGLTRVMRKIIRKGGAEKLETLVWRLDPNAPLPVRCPMLGAWPASNGNGRPIDVYVENLPIDKFRASSFFLHNVISLELVTAHRWRTSSFHHVIDGFRQNLPGLKTLVYRDHSPGPMRNVSFVGPMPKITELTLERYPWNEVQVDPATSWDFSQLKTIELMDVSMLRFLSTVSYSDFPVLEHLTIQSRDSTPEMTQATHLLESLLHHIQPLKTIRLSAHFSVMKFKWLGKHSASLRTLSLKNCYPQCHAVGLGGYPEKQLTWNIWKTLRGLESLEIDWSPTNAGLPREMLRMWASFPKLHTLKLHVPSSTLHIPPERRPWGPSRLLAWDTVKPESSSTSWLPKEDPDDGPSAQKSTPDLSEFDPLWRGHPDTAAQVMWLLTVYREKLRAGGKLAVEDLPGETSDDKKAGKEKVGPDEEVPLWSRLEIHIGPWMQHELERYHRLVHMGKDWGVLPHHPLLDTDGCFMAEPYRKYYVRGDCHTPGEKILVGKCRENKAPRFKWVLRDEMIMKSMRDSPEYLVTGIAPEDPNNAPVSHKHF